MRLRAPTCGACTHAVQMLVSSWTAWPASCSHTATRHAHGRRTSPAWAAVQDVGAPLAASTPLCQALSDADPQLRGAGAASLPAFCKAASKGAAKLLHGGLAALTRCGLCCLPVGSGTLLCTQQSAGLHMILRGCYCVRLSCAHQLLWSGRPALAAGHCMSNAVLSAVHQHCSCSSNPAYSLPAHLRRLGSASLTSTRIAVALALQALCRPPAGRLHAVATACAAAEASCQLPGIMPWDVLGREQHTEGDGDRKARPWPRGTDFSAAVLSLLQDAAHPDVQARRAPGCCMHCSRTQLNGGQACTTSAQQQAQHPGSSWHVGTSFAAHHQGQRSSSVLGMHACQGGFVAAALAPSHCCSDMPGPSDACSQDLTLLLCRQPQLLLLPPGLLGPRRATCLLGLACWRGCTRCPGAAPQRAERLRSTPSSCPGQTCWPWVWHLC